MEETMLSTDADSDMEDAGDGGGAVRKSMRGARPQSRRLTPPWRRSLKRLASEPERSKRGEAAAWTYPTG
jgi:hypothetical protein